DSVPLKTSAGKVATPLSPGNLVLRGIHVPPRVTLETPVPRSVLHLYSKLRPVPSDSPLRLAAAIWVWSRSARMSGSSPQTVVFPIDPRPGPNYPTAPAPRQPAS